MVCLFVFIACSKEADGFWNLKRENKIDLLNKSIDVRTLVQLDFTVSNITTNSFQFQIEKAVLNNGLQIEESGICYSKNELPDVGQNKTKEISNAKATSLENNTRYYVRAYVKINNTLLSDGDPTKYFIIYSAQKPIKTLFERCFDFKSTTSLSNSGWILNNFWITSNPNDNNISNSWISTGVSNLNQTCYNLPANTSLNFICTLNTNQNIVVEVDNVVVTTILVSGNVSIPLPEGTVDIKITATDNDPNAVLYIGDMCLK